MCALHLAGYEAHHQDGLEATPSTEGSRNRQARDFESEDARFLTGHHEHAQRDDGDRTPKSDKPSEDMAGASDHAEREEDTPQRGRSEPNVSIRSTGKASITHVCPFSAAILMAQSTQGTREIDRTSSSDSSVPGSQAGSKNTSGSRSGKSISKKVPGCRKCFGIPLYSCCKCPMSWLFQM